MAKLSALDRAIAHLESERAVIDLAIAKLRAQQAQPVKPRTKKAKPQIVTMEGRS